MRYLLSFFVAAPYMMINKDYLINKANRLMKSRNNKDHKELVLDGLYGGNTKKMTTLFQRNRGLKENGCFGKLCLAEAKKMI